MKIILSIWLAMLALARAADLDFPEALKEIHAAADAKSVTADFEFTNRSNKPVKVSKYEPGCSCVSVLIQDGKLLYNPGESGLIRATFSTGNFSGMVDKVVALWLDDASIDKDPSMKLTMRVFIPVIVEMEPKTVKWDLGGKVEPKTIRVTMKHDKPIHLVSVESSNDSFKYENKTVEEGKIYDLIITPVDTKDPSLCIFRLVTDCEIEKFKVQQGFGVIRKPLASEVSHTP